jgi:hypothetical protein
MKTRNKGRAIGSKTVTFSCSELLDLKIRAAAAKDGRPMSNWIVRELANSLGIPIEDAVSVRAIPTGVKNTRPAHALAPRRMNGDAPPQQDQRSA